jgi:hypothetical protein
VGIEANCHMGGMLIIDQVHQCISKTKLRIRIAAFGSDTGVAYQGIICAEYKGQRVQEKYFFLHERR